MIPIPASSLALLLAATAFGGERFPRNTPQIGPEIHGTSLTRLMENPLPALGREVRFELQWKGWRADFTPMGSRFDPFEWRSFEAWADDAWLWEKEAYESPARHLFVRRGRFPESILAHAQPFQRFRVTGILRQVFLGRPWIEVVALERLPHRVQEGSLLHVERAIGCMEKGHWQLAIDQLERARGAPLPAHVDREIQRMSLECGFVAAELSENP